MTINNEMRLQFSALSQNEGFARVVVSAFVSQLNPTIEELADIKTAVSEAVTNCIVHGYENSGGMVEVRARLELDTLFLEIEDQGVGIEDINKAMQPFYTSKPDADRSGMGFTVMETFMSGIEVTSKPGKGTLVKMHKRIVPPKQEAQLQ